MIEGNRIYGPWRSHADQAATDVRAFRERGEQLRDVEELLTLEEGMKAVLETTEARGGSNGTLRHYRECFRTLYRCFGGDTPLHEIDASAIEEFRTARRSQVIYRCRCRERAETCPHEGRLVSVQRIEKDIRALGRIFSVAIKSRRFPGANPVQQVERGCIKHRESEFYTVEDMVEILASIRACRDRSPTADRFHDVVAFFFLSGARLGELSHLRARMVDLHGGTVKIPLEGKSGERVLPLSEPFRIVAARMIHGLEPANFVLMGKTAMQREGNVKSNEFPRWRSKLPERLRPHFHAHVLRHSFKTHLENSGTPGHHSDRLTGHSGRTVSSRYVHATLLQLRRTMSLAFDHLTEPLLGHGAAEADAS